MATKRQFQGIALSVLINALDSEFYDAFPDDGAGLRFQIKETWKRAKSALRALVITPNQYASWQDQQVIDEWAKAARPAMKLTLRMTQEQVNTWLEIGEKMAVSNQPPE